MASTPTRSPNWRRLGHSQSPVIDEVISKKKDLSEAQASFSWMGANLAGAIVAYMERDFALFFGDHLSVFPFRDGAFSILILLFVVNALVDFVRFARPMLSRAAAIELTEAEQKLLGVKQGDVGGFRLAKPSSPTPSTPPKTFVGISPRPPSPLHPGTPTALNQSLFNTSSGSLPPSADSSLTQRRTPKIVSMNETISDHNSLQEYLKEHEASERRKRLSLTELSPATSSNTSFWAANRGGGGVSIADSATVLRKYQYQLASKSPQTTKTSGSSDDPDNPNAVAADDVWARYDVSDRDLMQWTMNLRNWISETILVPLVKEIDAKNDKLRRTGHGDSLIGEVGLATLKRVDASLDLDLMIQYLEVHENQEYLVKRIRTLAKGGCMSSFNATGGDSFKDKPWSESLPTDASIVLHCFAAYLDSQLPLTSFHPDLKAFTRQHLIKTPDKVNLTKKDNLLIYQSTLVPPQFKVVIGETVFEVAKGHNNLFHSLVLFLLHIKSLEHGVLGRINLGLTGLNILNVLN